MNTSLRKGNSHIYVAYSDGGWTNSLIGRNFSVDESKEELNFKIDLSGNYKVKNKSSNSYLDIQELSGSNSTLSYIQIDDKQILDGLSKARSRHPDAAWYLTLDACELGLFKYSVKPEPYSLGYQFNVVNV